jgi:hypothetical protein
MKKSEFAKQYKKMEILYGIKSDGHFEIWFDCFGETDFKVFEEQVRQVIEEYRPFGQDRWPTPGDFSHIINGNSAQMEVSRFSEQKY